MLRMKITEPEQWELAPSIVFTPKKAGSLQFCVDYLMLNAVTVKHPFPNSQMDECIDSLREGHIS